LYERLLLASKKKDEKALREILTDDYSQVMADGKIRTRAMRISDTLSAGDTTEILTLESFQAQVYQNAAVGICRVREKGASKGVGYDKEMLSTATFVKVGNAWRIAATHLTFLN